MHALPHRLVREQVELLLQVSRNVHGSRRAEDVRQSGAAHVARDDFRGQAQVIEQVRQLTRRLGVEPLLLHDEPFNRDDF